MKDLLDQKFEALGMGFFQYLIASTNKGSNSSKIKLFLAFLAILAFVGVEAVKIVFRKNFGVKGISTLRLAISIIIFGMISSFGFVEYYAPTDLSKGYGHSSFLAMGVLYAILTTYLIVKGWIEKTKSSNVLNEYYRGDSVILAFLMKGEKGWKQSTVQNFAEPVLMLALGFFFFSINPFLGIPIAFCGLSVWFNLILELAMDLGGVSTKLANMGYEYSQTGTFSEVVN